MRASLVYYPWPGDGPGGADTSATAALTPPPPESVLAKPTYLPPEREPVRRTLLVQALVDTFSQVGARLGAVWIGIVVFFAVFAPFVASSFPLAMKMRDGSWRFPLFAHLYPIDVTLLIMFFAMLALLLLWRKLELGLAKFSLALLIVLAAAVPLSYWLTNPPRNVVYEQYRDLERRGE